MYGELFFFLHKTNRIFKRSRIIFSYTLKSDILNIFKKYFIENINEITHKNIGNEIF
jgi:hypothetical protein